MDYRGLNNDNFLKMNFTYVRPISIEEEKARKKLVLTLIVAALPFVFLSFYYYKQMINFFKTKIGLFLLFIALCFLIYAHVEPYFLKYNFKEIVVEKQFKDFTAVQLSDIHFQWPYKIITTSKLEKIVKRVNEINPDFIFLTGDYISRYRTYKISKYNTETISYYLGQLKAKRGVYAILGNNDRCAGNMLIDEFKKNNITLLRNETVINDDIAITGLMSSKNIEKCKQHLNSTKLEEAPLKICLAHEPDTALATNQYFDLQFSGHTHGGQCIAPFGIGPIISPTMGRKFIVGVYKVGNMILHVSTGVGSSPLPKPLVRFNNFPSVDVIHVVSKI